MVFDDNYRIENVVCDMHLYAYRTDAFDVNFTVYLKRNDRISFRRRSIIFYVNDNFKIIIDLFLTHERLDVIHRLRL